MNQLKEKLQSICSKYTDSKYILTDPILFPYRFKNSEDIEFISLITALFSYGNVSQITLFLEKLLQVFGENPKINLLENSFSIPKEIYYRFQTYKDIQNFFIVLREMFLERQSLEELFYNESGDTQKGVINFQRIFHEKMLNLKLKPDRGLLFLIGKGLPNSPNKRYHMFLRWMVRRKFPDFGIYRSIQPHQLIYPLDTHILKFSKLLGFYSGSSGTYATSKKITEEFKKIENADPLAFDFPLSRLGILKKCKNTYIPELCEFCEIRKGCKIYALPR